MDTRTQALVKHGGPASVQEKDQGNRAVRREIHIFRYGTRSLSETFPFNGERFQPSQLSLGLDAGEFLSQLHG